jgi:hypothetical protein
MKHRMIIIMLVIVAYASNLSSWGQNISNEEQIKTNKIRSENEQGWQVPGIERYNRNSVHNKIIRDLEGVKIQVSSSKIDAQNRDVRLYKITVPSSDKSENKLTAKDVVINRITEYAIGDKPFCYVVSMSPHNYDEKTGISSVVGYEYSYAYYDEDGSGHFQTMEYVSTIGNGWQLYLPNWVKKTTSSK